jgi:Leucine-rich repeat (LRR) protein
MPISRPLNKEILKRMFLKILTEFHPRGRYAGCGHSVDGILPHYLHEYFGIVRLNQEELGLAKRGVYELARDDFIMQDPAQGSDQFKVLTEKGKKAVQQGIDKMKLPSIDIDQLLSRDDLRSNKNLQTLILVDCKITDASMPLIAEFTELKNLGLGGTQITDAGMAHLRKLSKVESIGVSSPGVAGPGYDHLKALPKLRTLGISGKVQPSIWKHVGQLDTIVTLFLNDSTADDAALAQLKCMTKLVGMEAHRTQVTDAGLKHLLDLPSLTGFYIVADGVTAQAHQAAIKELAKRRAKGEADPDRRAAEWVLSIGGKVTIRVGDKEQVVTTAKELPPATFQLVLVELGGNQQLTNDELRQLKNLTNLAVLGLDGTRFRDEGLVHLKDLRNLRVLSLNGTRVGDAGLDLIKNLPTLAELNLRRTRVGDDGLDYLKSLPKLDRLYLDDTKVGNGGLSHLSGKNLSTLTLADTLVTDAGLEHLATLTGLRALSLSNNRVTDAGLGHFKGLTNLTDLWLGGTQVTNNALAHVKGLNNLTRLMLDRTRISDAGLEHLKGLAKLTHLNLSKTQVGDAGLKHLHGLIRLEALVITGTKVTADGVAAMQKALPKCKIAWDGGVIEPAN